MEPKQVENLQEWSSRWCRLAKDGTSTKDSPKYRVPTTNKPKTRAHHVVVVSKAEKKKKPLQN